MCPLRVFVILFSALFALAAISWSLFSFEDENKKESEEERKEIENNEEKKSILAQMTEFLNGVYLYKKIQALF